MSQPRVPDLPEEWRTSLTQILAHKVQTTILAHKLEPYFGTPCSDHDFGARAPTDFWRTSPNRFLAHKPKQISGARAPTDFWRTSPNRFLAPKPKQISGAQAQTDFWRTSPHGFLAHKLVRHSSAQARMTFWCISLNQSGHGTSTQILHGEVRGAASHMPWFSSLADELI